MDINLCIKCIISLILYYFSAALDLRHHYYSHFMDQELETD